MYISFLEKQEMKKIEREREREKKVDFKQKKNFNFLKSNFKIFSLF